MSVLATAKMYARYMAGLRGYLRDTVTLDQAKAAIQQRLRERDTNFLRLVEKGIYGHEGSPYLPLLKLAGVEMGDLRMMVRDRGVEGTLRALREAGVYVTFEEFKGRKPIIRNGRVFPVNPHDFDNPYARRHYEATTGGSTGSGTRVGHDLSHLAVLAEHQMLTHYVHDVLDVPTAIWRGVLPDSSGLTNALRMARFGRYPEKWFSPVAVEDISLSLVRFRIAMHYTVVLARLVGAPLPWPEPVPLDRAIVVARWAVERVGSHGACAVIAQVSKALRVSLAAQEAGLDLTGVTFVVAGEPATQAKLEGIRRSGARHFTTYGANEMGRIGMGCGHPADGTDVHLFTDLCAVIQHPRTVPGSETTVPAFNVTTLASTAPKILLNTEVDDYGVIEERSCGCLLGELGLTSHARQIYSFRKLTGEGVTLVGSEMLHILEEVLPARFGGSPLDYQLMEEEDEQGFTRLSLLVSPSVELTDEGQAIKAVLDAMERTSVGAGDAAGVLRQAGTLRVKRLDPILTPRGKLMPLHIARHDANVT